MKVVGFISQPRRQRVVKARPCCLQASPSSRAMRSTTQNPRLCRVSA